MENLIHIDPVPFVTCAQCHVELDTEGLPAFSSIICPQCGVETIVPGQLGNFILTQLLGMGGMGGVYAAHDKVLNRAVAIKVMNKRLGEDKEFVDNFLREAQAAARINHPSVVQIHSFGQENGMPYIVMELITGGSFDKVIANRGGKVDAPLALRIGQEVAEGLKHAAADGLVHGDVKPENILLDDEGHAKLVDFGIASLSGHKSDEIWGTPYYIAPEKVRRQKTDFRADIYSLGATLFHAIAGVPPFEGQDSVAVVKARLEHPAPPLASIAKGVPPEAAAIIDRMLQTDPAQRYPTYDSLLGDMRRYVEKAAPKNTSSKRVVIKGKGGTGNQAIAMINPTTGSLVVPEATTPPPKKKGIVLQKGIRTTVRTAAATGYHATPAAAGDDAGGAPKKNNGLLIGLIAGISLFALIIIASISAFFIISHNNAKKAAALDAEKAAQRHTAVTTLRAAANKIQALNTDTTNKLAIAEASVKETTLKITDLFGIGASELKPDRPKPQPEKTETETQPAEAEAPTEADAPAEAETPEAEPPAPAEEPPPPADDSQIIIRLVRDMHLSLYILEDAATATRRMHDTADSDLMIANSASTHTHSISNSAATLAAEFDAYTADIRINPAATANAARAINDNVKKITAKIATAQEEKERKRAEDLRLAAERQAESDRQAKENIRAQAVAAEKERVRDANERVLLLCKDFDITAARRILREIGDLEHPEARADLHAAQSRVDHFQQFQKFLLERIPGWQNTLGQSWRIDKAEPRYLVINGVEKRWRDLEALQMFLIIRHFISDEKQARQLPLRIRANAQLDAALYIAYFMHGVSPVVTQEQTRLRQAAESALPSLKEEALKLFPEPPPEEPADTGFSFD